MFTFLHAADIHLDSPLCGLERYEGAPVDELRCATREALRNLVDLAISEEVNFLLIAGDLYDGDWKDYNTGLFFAKEMSRLREAGVKVYIVFGNHDAASQITKRLESIPSNVYHFSTKKPKTEIIEDIGVAIHGRSFPKRAVTKDISASYPEARPGYFNIGIIHTSLTGREGHEPYAPCTIDGLLSKNYDYWALGHVHKREVLFEDPWIIFPGNVQGRNIRETGAKGCTLVSVDDKGNSLAEHRDLDVLRWEVCNVDGSGAGSPEEVVERLRFEIKKKIKSSDGRPLALRVFISGRCSAHEELSANPGKWTNEIRAASTDESGGCVWIEKIKFNTKSPLDLEKMAERNDPIGDLLRFINKIDLNLADPNSADPNSADPNSADPNSADPNSADPNSADPNSAKPNSAKMDELDGDIKEIMDLLSGDFVKLKAKLPAEIHQEGKLLDIGDPETLREILEDVRHTLVSRLLSKEGF